MDSTSTRGSCVCQAVKFELTGAFRFFRYCHCHRCRKRSGSAHAANVLVMKDQLTWTAGESEVQTFELETAASWGNAFCRCCGSGLPWLTRNGRAYVAPAGSFDDAPSQRPTENIFFESRAPWYENPADLTVFDEGPLPKGS